MPYPPRTDQLVRALQESRRRLFVRLADGRRVMVGATDHIVTVLFLVPGKADDHDTHVFLRRDLPTLYEDGYGWNLAALQGFIDGLGGLGATVATSRPAERIQVRRHHSMNARRRRHARLRQRRQPSGSACLLLRCEAIKQIVPCLDGETVKFFLLAAAHANDQATAWAEQRAYWAMGYHPEKVARRMDELEAAGLMRWIRRNQYDPVMRRKLPNVYQFNPTLVYVRREMRAAAYGLSDVKFADVQRIEKPDRESRTKSDQGQKAHGKKPDRTFPSTSDHNQLENLTNTREPKPRTTTSEAPAPIFQGARVESAKENSSRGRSSPLSGAKSRPGKTKSTQPAPDGASAQSAPARATSPPLPPRSALPLVARDYNAPLPDPALESLSHRLQAKAPTRIYQARELVDRYGCAAVEWGLTHLTAEQKRGAVPRPFGLMKYWLKRGMSGAADEPPTDEKWYLPG